MSSKSIGIAIPCYTNAPAEFVKSVFYLGMHVNKMGWDHGLLTLSNSSNINRARSSIANFFMQQTTHEWVLWLDNDIVFSPEHIDMLMAIDEPFVCGCYPAKTPEPIYPVTFRLDAKGWMISHKKNPRYVAVRNIGFGLVLTHRSVFERIAQHFGDSLVMDSVEKRIYNGALEEQASRNVHYFMEAVTLDGKTTFVGEDTAFFLRYAQAGGTAWLALDANVAHVGSHVFQPVPV